MPLKKIRIQAKPEGFRGMSTANEVMETLCDNWSQLQDNYLNQTETEKEDMLEYFNNAIENLGDTLFGEDCDVEAFKDFVTGLEKGQQAKFMTAIEEGLAIET